MKIHRLILAIFIAACSTKTAERSFQPTPFRQIETRVDSSFVEFKVDNIMACYTTLTDLQKFNIELKKINKEELDSLYITYSNHSDICFVNQDKGLIIGTYFYTELI